ncbi:HEAT repeat domain-containing protein, partial [Verrucomicrobiota bacterium]
MAIPAILTTLAEEDETEIRCFLAVALGRHTDEKARTGLIAAMHQPDAGVRAAVLESLLGVDDPYRVKGIVCGMGDRDATVGHRATSALAT